MKITPPHCEYCGNNQVSHVGTLISDYLSMMNKPLERLGTSSLGRLLEKYLFLLAPPLVQIGERFGILRFSDDIEKAPNDRSRVIWEEAQRRGIKMRQFMVGKRPIDFYEAKLPNRTILFESLPVPTELQTPAIRWMDDKLKLKKKLTEAGIPVARGDAFTTFTAMRSLFRKIDKPVIVKPAVGSRGRHTTTFIYTEEQLKKAFDVGKQIARRLVMEEHLIGSVYRATIIGGKLVGVLRGDPPRITGDGKSTVTELIKIKNDTRHTEVKEFKPTEHTEEFLARNDITLDTVLPKGKVIDLTEKIGASYGGYRAEESHICHPKIKATLEAAGRVVDYPTMGFDFIIEDVTKDPDTQKWGIIECNSLPFIDLHHHPFEGPAINVAAYVWDFWN